MFQFNNVGAGASLFVPVAVQLTVSGTCNSSALSGCVGSGGLAVLVTGTDSHQAWARIVLLGGIGIVGLGVTARLADAGLVTTRTDAPVRVAR